MLELILFFINFCALVVILTPYRPSSVSYLRDYSKDPGVDPLENSDSAMDSVVEPWTIGKKGHLTFGVLFGMLFLAIYCLL